MTASIFLAAFIGCLLAFAFVVVALLQCAGWLVRRFMKRAMPEMIHAATGSTHIGGDEFGPGAVSVTREAAEVFEKLREAARHTPPGITPHLPTIACVKCKGTIDIPYEVELQPAVTAAGWRFDYDQGWICKSC